jgi:uncharacterized membrane protein YfcA
MTTWEELSRLGPGGSQVSGEKFALLSLATVGAGALAGFIGFGNGLLFATMLIVGLGHPTQEVRTHLAERVPAAISRLRAHNPALF